MTLTPERLAELRAPLDRVTALGGAVTPGTFTLRIDDAVAMFDLAETAMLIQQLGEDGVRIDALVHGPWVVEIARPPALVTEQTLLAALRQAAALKRPAP